MRVLHYVRECFRHDDGAGRRPVWQSFGGREAFLERIGETIPLGRMLTAEAVAEQARFLLSGAAALMTGQALVVDGGELIS
jgi:NAD(P)-dependent dehydrogenase (short-subunit alcohol dehydrogenase family)